MFKYFNDKKFSKCESLNILMERIKNKEPEFYPCHVTDDVMDALHNDSEMGGLAFRRVMLYLREMKPPWKILPLVLRASFSKLPFQRCQNWEIGDNEIIIGQKRLAFDPAFIILFHSEDIKSLVNVFNLFESGFDLKVIIENPSLLSHVGNDFLIKNGDKIHEKYKFCECPVVNGFHHEQCGIPDCSNRVIGMRHLCCNGVTWAVTLCKNHFDQIPKHIRFKSRITCL